MWAALTASPGATAGQIATAAGTSRIIAGRELAALETSGLATRTPGARNGRTTAPATWQPTPQAASPAPGTPPADQAPPAGPTGRRQPRTRGRRRGPARTRSGDAPDEGRRQRARRRRHQHDAGAGETASAPADTGAPSSADGGRRAGGRHPRRSRRCRPRRRGAPPRPRPTVSRSPPRPVRRRCCCASWPPQPPGPRRRCDGGDTAAALAAMDAICAGAAQSRRLLKAAATGRKPRGTGPAARPGQLRDLVAAHLAAHPGAEFTPHAIGRVLGRSSGAVANALDRLTALGQAQLTSDKPRRYQHQAATAPPAPGGAT